MANKTNYERFAMNMEIGKKAQQEKNKAAARKKTALKKSKEYQPKITKFDKPVPYEELEKYLNEK